MNRISKPRYRRQQEKRENHTKEAAQHKEHIDTLTSVAKSIHRIVAEQQADRDEQNSRETARRRRENLTIIALAMTVAVGACGIWITHKDTITAIHEASSASAQQHNDTIGSNDISRQSFTAVQRPFVVFPDIATFPRKIGNAVLLWDLGTDMENAGNTTAPNVRAFLSYCFRRDDLPADFTFPILGDAKPISVVLAPKQHLVVGTTTQLSAILASVQAKEVRLFIWGSAKYNDMFPKTELHITRYCYELSSIYGDLRNPQNGISFGFTQCSANNCADHDCSYDEPRANPAEIGCVTPPLLK